MRALGLAPGVALLSVFRHVFQPCVQFSWDRFLRILNNPVQNKVRKSRRDYFTRHWLGLGMKQARFYYIYIYGYMDF